MKMKKILCGLPVLGTALPALAEGPTYTVPQGVTDAVGEAKQAATLLANEALPAVAAIGLAFVGIAIVWLLVRAIRKGAK